MRHAYVVCADTAIEKRVRTMKDESVERAWIRWVQTGKKSFLDGWLWLQSGSNQLVDRIVSSFQRFASGKSL
jgi:hypothetical protein